MNSELYLCWGWPTGSAQISTNSWVPVILPVVACCLCIIRALVAFGASDLPRSWTCHHAYAFL